jgi:hypothetical protein
MMSTEDGGLIPAMYREFVEVISTAKPETLLLHQLTDHAIDLEPGYNKLYGRIHNLLEFELSTSKDYIQANLANALIWQSSSPAAAPILIPPKMDGRLRHCVDCCELNIATVKNRYPLPLSMQMYDCVHLSRIFRKLDLHGAFNRMWIKDGYKYN